MQRLMCFALVLAGVVLGAPGAEAALRRFNLNTINLTESPETSPTVRRVGADEPPSAPFDTVFLDDAVPGAPRLAKFRFKSRSSITVQAVGLAGAGAHVFLNNNFIEGPGPILKPAVFTGTGHTAGGSTITWGIVTGWTITGAQYCDASPPSICDLADQQANTTGEPSFHSDFYDLGTWYFHTTGFTATPFVHQYISISFGNNQRWIRGFSIVGATVPALPLIGLTLLGGSLVAGAVTALRRRQGR